MALKKTLVLLCGSFAVHGDDAAFLIEKQLKNAIGKDAKIIRCADPFEIVKLSEKYGKMIIVDATEGIKKAKIITTEELENPAIVTPHDLDVSFALQLLAKIEPEKMKKIRIVALPMEKNRGMKKGKKTEKEAIELIRKMVSERKTVSE